MQKIILVLTMMALFTANANCQGGKSTAIADTPTSQRQEKIYEKVDVEAAFQGGDVEWRNYLAQHLKDKTPTTNGAPQGSYTVIVKFVVSRNGTVGKVIMETNHGYGMEAEVRSLIRNGPKWIPAIAAGHNVASWRRQPVTFVVL